MSLILTQARALQTGTGTTDLERLLPLLNTLPDIVREVGIARKTRLNPWERESLRTSGSKRSRRFREKIIRYYNRANSSGQSVKCQILDEFVPTDKASDEATGIIAAHIWKASTRGHGLADFGLNPENVNDPKNGMFLTKGLEDAFDRQQICFLYNLLHNQLVLWVADQTIMDKQIAGSDKKFSVVHQKPLLCPPNRMPFRRLLSWHARIALELRPQTLNIDHLTSEYDTSPGRQNAVVNPMMKAIHDLVEPGDDASSDDGNDASSDDGDA